MSMFRLKKELFSLRKEINILKNHPPIPPHPPTPPPPDIKLFHFIIYTQTDEIVYEKDLENELEDKKFQIDLSTLTKINTNDKISINVSINDEIQYLRIIRVEDYYLNVDVEDDINIYNLENNIIIYFEETEEEVIHQIVDNDIMKVFKVNENTFNVDYVNDVFNVSSESINDFVLVDKIVNNDYDVLKRSIEDGQLSFMKTEQGGSLKNVSFTNEHTFSLPFSKVLYFNKPNDFKTFNFNKLTDTKGSFVIELNGNYYQFISANIHKSMTDNFEGSKIKYDLVKDCAKFYGKYTKTNNLCAYTVCNEIDKLQDYYLTSFDVIHYYEFTPSATVSKALNIIFRYTNIDDVDIYEIIDNTEQIISSRAKDMLITVSKPNEFIYNVVCDEEDIMMLELFNDTFRFTLTNLPGKTIVAKYQNNNYQITRVGGSSIDEYYDVLPLIESIIPFSIDFDITDVHYVYVISCLSITLTEQNIAYKFKYKPDSITTHYYNFNTSSSNIIQGKHVRLFIDGKQLLLTDYYYIINGKYYKQEIVDNKIPTLLKGVNEYDILFRYENSSLKITYSFDGPSRVNTITETTLEEQSEIIKYYKVEPIVANQSLMQRRLFVKRPITFVSEEFRKKYIEIDEEY